MKKRIFALVISGVVAVAAAAWAGPGMGPGMMGGPGMMARNSGDDQAEARLIAKFREETKELRREMAVKRVQMRALMRAENPDEVKIGKLAAELFDLQEKLRKKAEEAGIPVSACGRACGKDARGGGMMGGGMRHRMMD